MYFAVTIDTEEDNWGEYARPSFTVENLTRIPRLQELFAARGIRPTYLITHPVATSQLGIEILGTFRDRGDCEIGTHLHPWNTPPVEEELSTFNSYISHLPPALQLRKIRTLHDTIIANFGVTPTSYRSGRWGFSDDVARNLIRLGYQVDTSISPALDWREYEGPDYSTWSAEPFVYQVNGSNGEPGGTLLEVPATVDFVQDPRALASSVYRSIRRVRFGKKVLGALGRLGALNLICLSPEIDDAPRMIRLTKALLNRGTRVVNMFFHSPSLLEGCSPFVKTRSDVDGFLDRIDRVLAFAQSAGLVSATLSEISPATVGATTVKLLPSPVQVLPVRAML